MITAVLCGLISALIGLFQSLVTGVIAKRWDGGHGLLWAVAFALVGGIAAGILGWPALALMLLLGVAVSTASSISITRS